MGNILKYKDKYFSILGDSLSTFKGVSEPSFAYFYDDAKKLEADVIAVSDTWWGMVIDYLGGKLLVNNSFSGSTVSYSPLYECESYGCSKERTSSLDKNGVEPDVIMIYLGTNDWGAGFKLSPTFLDTEKSLSVFSTAYEEMLLKVKNKYKNAEIWCFTLTESYSSKIEEFEFPKLKHGYSIADFSAVIKEVAESNGYKVIDLFKHCKPFDTIDGFHPNKEGMKTIATAVIDILKTE